MKVLYMPNDRITKKERGLLKGAIRRVFSRSDLRRAVLASAKVTHTDGNRPRVKTWYKCIDCKGYFAGFEMQVDHKIPIVPVDSSLEEMTWDSVVDRTWCQENNLAPLCKPCHAVKTKLEAKERRLHRKGIKK